MPSPVKSERMGPNLYPYNAEEIGVASSAFLGFIGVIEFVGFIGFVEFVGFVESISSVWVAWFVDFLNGRVIE
jgi:hypothetical protein